MNTVLATQTTAYSTGLPRCGRLLRLPTSSAGAKTLAAAILVLACLFDSNVAAGQDSVSVDADVETVISGGAWRRAGAEGTYRAIVVTGGLEHIVSALTLQWLRTDGAGGFIVDSSKALDTASWRLGRPRFSRRANTWYLEVDGVEPHRAPAPSGRWTFRLGPPGQVSVYRTPTAR